MAVVPFNPNRPAPGPKIDDSFLMMAAAQIRTEGLAAATSLEPTTYEKLKDEEIQMEQRQELVDRLRTAPEGTQKLMRKEEEL